MKYKMQKAFTAALAVTMIAGINPAEAMAAYSGTQTTSVTVSPDEYEDFDAYDMDVTITLENDILTSIDLTSAWGRKATQNQKYSTNALSGIASDLAAGTSVSAIDAVSGATCSSSAIKSALTSLESSSAWTSVSPELVLTLNGSAISTDTSGGATEEDEDEGEEESGGGRTEKGGSTLTLPEGTSASYENIYALDGIVKIHLTLPENYTATGINLVRVGNAAYMRMKDTELFDSMFAYDEDSAVLTIYTEALDGATSLNVSIETTDGTESGTVNVAVAILSESSVTISDKTAEYTGSAIEMDTAVVTGSTGEVTYTYYTDEACTQALSEAPTEPGTYYVTATVAEDAQYYSATSTAATLTITAAENQEEDTNDSNTSDSDTSDSQTSDQTGDSTSTSDSTGTTTTDTSSTSGTTTTSGSTTTSDSTTTSGTTTTSTSPVTGDTSGILAAAVALLASLGAGAGSLGFRFIRKRH